MNREVYGNYVLYYEGNFAALLHRNADEKGLAEKIMETFGHGFTHSTAPDFFRHVQPVVTNNGIEAVITEYNSLRDILFFPYRDHAWILHHASKLNSIEEVYSEKGIKIGNRRLKKLFKQNIDIEIKNPQVARFEGTYKEYSVKGLNLGHTYYAKGLNYIFENDFTHIASTNFPKPTYKIIKYYREKFPGEELIGYIDRKETIKIRRNCGDLEIQTLVSNITCYPSTEENGRITLEPVPPHDYQKAIQKTEKFIEAYELPVKRVKAMNKYMIFESKLTTVFVTPSSIFVDDARAYPNDENALITLIHLLSYPF